MREIENIKEFIELQISGAEESTKERHASVESILFSEGYIKACRMILHYMKKLNKKYEI